MTADDGSLEPDGELVREAARGDDHAIAELVRRTQPAVWRWCRAHGSGDDTDDLVQETYMRALKSLHAYRGEAPFVVWLLSVARRVCADHVRRRMRQRRLMERLVARNDRGDADAQDSLGLFDLLGRLDPDRRDAFVLTQLVGLPYEDAATVMDCPVGTIRSRVARARGDLHAMVRRAEAV